MTQTDFLDGQLLIAMPGMSDPRFDRSVVYVCAHSSDGAMGLIINKQVPDIDFPELLERLNIPVDAKACDFKLDSSKKEVLFGGPVEPGRGFVLHSGEYNVQQNTLAINAQVGLTATLDVLHEIALGKGPEKSLLALGYAGWSPGQLESELLQNGWLNCPASDAILFGTDLDSKYDAALDKLGVDPAMLSANAGRA